MSFLQLPLEIRMSIYALAGLQRPCPINLLHETSLKRKRVPGVVCTTRDLRFMRGIGEPGEPDCHCPELPVSLLRVCRQVHKEALSVLYGNNTFMVLCGSHMDLRIFERLPLSGLKLMCSLMVRLNCWPCPNGHDFYTFSGERFLQHRFLDGYPGCRLCIKQHCEADSPLSLLARKSANIFREWSSASAILARSITPGRIHFSFIADVVGIPEAQIVLEKLFSLPRLKQLDLRLGRQPDWRLQDLACDAARIMTGAYQRKGVFPFEKLPDELQMRILEASGLVPNTKSASMVPVNVYRRSRKGHLEFVELRNRQYPIRGQKTWGPLWSGPDTSYHDFVFIRDNRLDIRGPRGDQGASCCRQCNIAAFGCCCHDRYAAVSAYCSCRLIPYALFYASKRMYHHATQVFYSRNIFVFHQNFSSTATFLEELKPSLARLLRQIHIHPPFIGYAHQGFVFASAHELDLERLVRVIKQKLTLRTLKLTFVTEDFRDTGLTLNEWQELYEEHCIVAKYMRLLDGVPKLSFRTFSLEWDEALERVAGGDDRPEIAPPPFSDL